MTWIYSIIFAGLMISSSSDLPKVDNYRYADASEKIFVKSDETEKFEQTYALNPNGRVRVSNVNGSIVIDTWERAEVKLEYVKTADAKENLAEVEIKIEAQPDSFSVETDYGDWKRQNSGGRKNYGKLQVEYRLTVPRGAVLDQIATVNGSVSISNAANVTKASAVNGEVRATNLRGAAMLETVNGTVNADFDQLQTGSRISLNTVNGTVNLTIPSDANATVKADTVNGQISNDFNLRVRKGEYVGRDLYGKIGSGDVQIRLNSVNGALSVKRKNDGKKLNPATNLLNLKSPDNDNDWDADDEDNSAVKPPKPPKPPKPSKPPVPPINGEINSQEINQSIKESLKAAQKEIAKMQPESSKMSLEALKMANAQLNSAELKAQIAQAMAEVNWTVGSPNIENKSESFSVKGTPKVTIDVKNCAVTVRGWDKPEVQYSVTRFSKISHQTPLNLRATQDNSDITIKSFNDESAQSLDSFNELNRVHIEVFVPKKSNLKITTIGEIRLEGVSGTIDLRGADNSINVRDGDGFLTVSGINARIRIIGFRGEVESRSLDGAMFLEGNFQRLLAETSNGTIVLDLPENTNADLKSNREINFERVNASKKGEKDWRVGSGGAMYFLQSSDGEIFVRPATLIKAN